MPDDGYWRIGDDAQRMAQLPDGTLFIDLLAATVRHSSGEEPALWVVGELSAWLKWRLDVEKIDASKLVAAKLDVSYTTQCVKSKRKLLVSFDFDCRSRIETDETAYEGKLVERHTYHRRVGS